MNNERKEEIRLEDKKYGKRFALIMVLSLIVGLALGLGCIRLMDADQSPPLPTRRMTLPRIVSRLPSIWPSPFRPSCRCWSLPAPA